MSDVWADLRRQVRAVAHLRRAVRHYAACTSCQKNPSGWADALLEESREMTRRKTRSNQRRGAADAE